MMEKSIVELKGEKPRSNWVVHQYDLLKQLGTTYIDAVPSQHYRYGLSRFTTVTSPLRRYFDFVMHHQIKAMLRRVSPPYTLMQLHDYIPTAHNMMGDIRNLQERSSKFWILNYLYEQYKVPNTPTSDPLRSLPCTLLQRDPKKRYKAIVLKPNSDLSRDQSTIMLTQFGLECDMTKHRYVNRGDNLWVKVDMVSPFYDKLIVKEIAQDTLLK